ncbi:unnamed protein product [Didymodactylos carnosus]|uniref:Uncharacterized protein n=1 Tax=Didymodactylos carnosus TaxID=1234261 RepID=A0A8S2IAR2_9BILA|nr:unnamed protein product [Didymodactylos carnosus]CAF3730545.1 unnamed protein product [Didymodactylos carnosus]
MSDKKTVVAKIAVTVADEDPSKANKISAATTVAVSKIITEGNNGSKFNLETYELLWLDANIYSTQDNLETLNDLRQIINQIRTFDDGDEYEQYVRQVRNEKIVLIVSGAMGREIVPRTHELQQLRCAYVFCGDKLRNE